MGIKTKHFFFTMFSKSNCRVNVIVTKRRCDTYDIRVCFSARHPLSSLKSPVIWIGEYYIHKYIVVGSWVKARNVEA